MKENARPAFLVALLSPVVALFLFLVSPADLLRLQNGLIGNIVSDELSFIWIWERISGNLFSEGALFDGKALYPYAESLISSETTFACALIYRLFLWCTENRPLSYNLTIISIFFLNYLSFYFFARLFTNRLWSSVAGIIFSFSLVRLAQIGHAHMLPQFAFPLYAYAFIRLKTTRRSIFAFWMGTALALQFYLSVNMGMILLVSNLPLIVLEAIQLYRARDSSQVLRYLLAALVFGTVSLPVSYSYYRVSLENGWKRSVGEARAYSTNIKGFLVVPEHHRFAPAFAPLIRYQEAARHEKCLFVGFSVFLLSFLGFRRLRAAARKKPRHTRQWKSLLANTWVFVVLLAWGTNAGLYNVLFFLVPGMNGIRVPSRFALAYLFLMAVLSALGARFLWKWLYTRLHGSRLATGSVFALLAAVFWVDTQVAIPVLPAPSLLGSTVFLKRRPDRYPVAYIYEGIHDAEAYYMYFSLEHEHPVLNGYAGFMPKETRVLRDTLKRFLESGSTDALITLRKKNMRYYVLDKQRLSADSIRLFETRLSSVFLKLYEDADHALYFMEDSL